jgi:hypothetical protein
VKGKRGGVERSGGDVAQRLEPDLRAGLFIAMKTLTVFARDHEFREKQQRENGVAMLRIRDSRMMELSRAQLSPVTSKRCDGDGLDMLSRFISIQCDDVRVQNESDVARGSKLVSISRAEVRRATESFERVSGKVSCRESVDHRPTRPVETTLPIPTGRTMQVFVGDAAAVVPGWVVQPRAP